MPPEPEQQRQYAREGRKYPSKDKNMPDSNCERWMESGKTRLGVRGVYLAPRRSRRKFRQ